MVLEPCTRAAAAPRLPLGLLRSPTAAYVLTPTGEPWLCGVVSGGDSCRLLRWWCRRSVSSSSSCRRM